MAKGDSGENGLYAQPKTVDGPNKYLGTFSTMSFVSVGANYGVKPPADGGPVPPGPYPSLLKIHHLQITPRDPHTRPTMSRCPLFVAPPELLSIVGGVRPFRSLQPPGV